VTLLIVGFEGLTHVGASFARAAGQLGLPHVFIDASRAFAAPRLLRVAAWHVAGHRPPKLRGFSDEVVAACTRSRPRWLLSTGLAPIDAAALDKIGRLGVERVNFLTDDPWNPGARANWFFDALKHYDRVFSPRRANLADLARHGCTVSYLPFGFDPELSFREKPSRADEWEQFASDVAFVGGADRDRVPYIQHLLRAGVRVGLYGPYWDRFPETRKASRGHADLQTVRKATTVSKISLCLVRRANRDGHVMRSLEIAAMGGCMLAEETDEHRALFGPDGQRVAYFRAIPEMLEQVQRLLVSPEERRRLASAACRYIQEGQNTYADRLRAMLDYTPTPAAQTVEPAIAKH